MHGIDLEGLSKAETALASVKVAKGGLRPLNFDESCAMLWLMDYEYDIERTFRFQPRWKEELVVTGPDGGFLLELPMGILSAYLPTEAAWKRTAPRWASDLWPILKTELEEWCRNNNALLNIDETAHVYPV